MKKLIFFAIAVFFAIPFCSQDFEETEILPSVNPTEFFWPPPALNTLLVNNLFSKDLDGDGDLDIIYSDFNDNLIKVLSNEGENVFNVVGNLGEFEDSGFVGITDLDGDGKIDVLVNSAAGLIRYSQLNNLNFDSGILIQGVESGKSIKFGDFDGDSDLDLISGINIYKNLSNNVFELKATLPQYTEIKYGLVGDYNSDNLDDIIFQTINDIQVLSNQGNYNFGSELLDVVWGPHLNFSHFEDINEDGNIEFYYTSHYCGSDYCAGTFSAYEYSSEGFEHLGGIPGSNNQVLYPLIVVGSSDFDGNGIKEIDFVADGIKTLDFDASSAPSNYNTIYPSVNDVRDYETKDFDGDGDEDILISYLSNQLIIVDNKRIVCSTDNFTFQPTGQSVSIDGNQATLEWDTYNHATKCQIKGNNDIFPNDLSFFMDVEPAQPLTFSKSFNLQPNTTYRWKVRCGCSVSPLVASDFSPYQYFTTPAFQGGENEMQLNNGDLKQTDADEFEIYPNPSTGIINLKNAEMGSRVDVFNAAGQVVYSEVLNKTYSELDLSNFSDGNYQIVLSSDHSTQIKQIVLKR